NARQVETKFSFLVQQRETLRVSLHQTVFDAVVYHLHKMPRSYGPDVRPTSMPRWSETLKYGPKPIDGLLRTADHQAVTFAQTPNTPARSGINKVNALRLKSRGAPNGVFVI